ncbi:leucine-rich repeat-containing protein [Tritrichomonas foetus]|uniref:Leucine-rich repeat-containing protein n=1 Tax=Tritrichomonas foetus TaxID=1144522 RepID=A0A1J4L3H6_9EUKA|nr:leucine-rich repeat-containing protein [Tritrichomonas foetus]|eukprot:OHT16469.1 leucine-rich repeat-containing protein [Tritrichomonas foetus]
MGPDASIQKLPANERTLDLSDKKLCFIPVKFSKKSKLAALILSKNQIHELPKNLRKLTNLVMSFNELTEITNDMEDGLLSYPLIESIDFSYNLLATFPSSVSNIRTLKTLSLFGNQITALDCSQSSLTYLDLGHNQLTSPPQIPETLQTLVLDCNHITDLKNLKNTSKITRLCLSLNKLELIDHSLSFPALTTLDVSRNSLKKLPNLLKVTPHLRQIDASDNLITELPNFPRTISEIVMRNNQISKLPDNFSNLSCLGSADFSQNLLEELPALPTVLQTLIIYDNRITSTEVSSLPDLSRFYIMNNRLTEIPNYKSNSLSEYFLSSNQIRRIDCNLLSKALNRLDITDNEVEELPDALFDSNIQNGSNQSLKLTHIYASKNKIKSLPPKYLESELIYLNLSENPIEELPKTNPPLLEQLYVEKCNLTSIPLPNEKSDELIELMASYNRISEIPSFTKLLILNLSNNSIQNFPLNLPPTIKFIDLSGNEIAELPDEFEYNELETIELSFNKISKLPSQIKLPKLQTLKIRSNPIHGTFNTTGLPSLVYLDATETNLTFTDDILQVERVLISNDSIIQKIEENPTEISENTESTHSTTNSTTKSSSQSSQSEQENDQNDSDREISYEEKSNIENIKLSSQEKSKKGEKSNSTEKLYTSSQENLSVTENSSQEIFSEISSSSKSNTKIIENVFRFDHFTDISYSTFRHERESLEDFILIEKSENTIFTGLFDARSGGKFAQKTINTLRKLINENPLNFTSDYFHIVCNKITDLLHDKTVFDGSSMAVIMMKNKEVLFTTIGDPRIIISKAEKGGVRVVQDNLESRRRCGNKYYGQLTISKTVGDHLVYGIDIKAQPMSLEIEENDRFLVMLSASVFEMLSMDQFDEICCQAKTANDVVMALKYTAMANMSSDNISVIAIELTQ